jgi:hypothetical protein
MNCRIISLVLAASAIGCSDGHDDRYPDPTRGVSAMGKAFNDSRRVWAQATGDAAYLTQIEADDALVAEVDISEQAEADRSQEVLRWMSEVYGQIWADAAGTGWRAGPIADQSAAEAAAQAFEASCRAELERLTVAPALHAGFAAYHAAYDAAEATVVHPASWGKVRAAAFNGGWLCGEVIAGKSGAQTAEEGLGALLPVSAAEHAAESDEMAALGGM